MCLTSCHNHMFGDWSVTKNPTCTENGVKTRYCSCGEKQSDAIPAIGHNYVDGECANCGDVKETSECKHKNLIVLQGKDSTCTEKGLTEGQKCSDCGEVLVAQQEAPLKAHTEEIIPAVGSTCTKTGLTEGKKCIGCGEVLVAQQEAPLKAHTEEIIPAFESTCNKTGLTEGKRCSTCGTTIIAQQVTPVIAHTYDDKYDETCNKCGFVREAECAHKETETIKGNAATCTSVGLTDGTKCTKCGEILTAQNVIAAKGHTEVIDSKVEATCTTTGLTEGKHCSFCGTVIVAQNVLSAKEHTEVTDSKVEATCTTTGLTEGKHCSVCGIITVSQNVVPSNGHNYESTINNSNATPVVITYTCPNCQDIYTKTITPIDFTITKENRVMIGYTGEAYESLIIPAIFEDDGTWYRVTSIGDSAFEFCSNIWEIMIPESVTSINSKAFYYCRGFGSIIIPDNVTSIGNDAFNNCEGLRSVTIGKSVNTIGRGAFWNCYFLESITIPDSVTTIGSDAFSFCSSLKSITIGESVTSIGKNAFCCRGLTSIVVDEKNAAYQSINGNLYSKDGTVLVAYAIGKRDTSFAFPDSVTTIGEWAFYDCYYLQSITIPNSVTCIGEKAFYGCSSLESITILNSVTSIGSYAFGKCTSHVSIVFEGTMEEWLAIEFGYEPFYNCSGGEIICYDVTFYL